MAKSYFSGPTFDDVLRQVIEEITNNGDRIRPTKGEADEISGVLVEIANPLARLSRTETRGRIFSALGELCWYLARTNALNFIEYYIPQYAKYSDGELIFGGYGPRLFAWRGMNQVENIIRLLGTNKHSRKAVIQLFDGADILEEHNDVPCTCTIQLMDRRDRLHMFVNMRSNDAYWGFPHDVFCFTMLQEIIARSLSLELGDYRHAVGSLHLYTEHSKPAKRFLREGWQPTAPIMPPMPVGDPWPGIELLLQAESKIRTGDKIDDKWLDQVQPYWADLIRLLQAYQAKSQRNLDTIKTLRGRMSSNVYLPFIDRVIRELTASRRQL